MGSEQFTGTERLYRDRVTGRKVRAVPGVQYVKPDGRRREGVVEIDVTEWPQERLDTFDLRLGLMEEQRIEVAFEEQDGGLIVYLDNGEFDYRIEIVGDRELPSTVTTMIEEFDAQDFLTKRSLHRQAEMGQDDVADLVAHDAAVSPFTVADREENEE